MKRKLVDYIELRRFRKTIVRKLLACTTSEEVVSILYSLDYSDRRWVTDHVRVALTIKDQTEMQKELKEYRRNVPKWRRKLIMREFEKRLYSTR